MLHTAAGETRFAINLMKSRMLLDVCCCEPYTQSSPAGNLQVFMQLGPNLSQQTTSSDGLLELGLVHTSASQPGNGQARCPVMSRQIIDKEGVVARNGGLDKRL
jgi:hypothetical protein